MRIVPTINIQGAKCIVRTVSGYSTVTPGTSTFISPTSVAFLIYNPLAYGQSIKFEFSKELGTNNTPATIRVVGDEGAPPPLTFVADL